MSAAAPIFRQADAAREARYQAVPGPWSTLALFDRFTPKDSGANRVLSNIAYGPGPRRTLDVYAPKARGERRPLVVFFYGGGWDSGNKAYYRWVGKALAAQGLVTVIPDYRLAPDAHFPEFVEDGAAAVAAARDLAADVGADPDRILLAGHSAGAYIAMMLALDARWLQAARVDPRLIRGAAGLSGPYDFYPFDVPASINAFGRSEAPEATQPVRWARPDAPPLWLAHGGRDTTVRVRNSTALAEAVAGSGGVADFRLYSDLDHIQIALALSVPFRWKAPVLRDLTDFLDRVG